jgi:hypothetical protein
MMRLLIGMLGCAMACSSMSEVQSTDFPTAAYATVASQAGDVLYEARTAPSQPPSRGQIALLLSVKDANGAPIDGLALEVTPWMPAMGHGASVTPSITARGDGDYLVNNLVLAMPGAWELRVSTVADPTATVIPITVQ